jgi:hypothetical protein
MTCHPPSSWNFFIYLICQDFQKIIGRIKIFDKCTSDAIAHGVRLLPPYRMALGVPTVTGHGGRGAANHREYWPVGPIPNAAAHGVRKSKRQGPRRQEAAAVGCGVSARLYKGSRPLPPAPLLPHYSFEIFGFQPLRSASKVCFLNLVWFRLENLVRFS